MRANRPARSVRLQSFERHFGRRLERRFERLFDRRFDRSELIAAIAPALFGAALVALLSITIAFAQSGGSYDLTWNTIDGGGGVSGGGTISLRGTIGQPDAGVLSGGTITLAGGFWKGGLGGPTSGVPDGEGEGPVAPALPLSFALYPNAPNPFSSSTVLTFDLPEASDVELSIYDATGSRVRRLVDDHIPAGHHLRIWDGMDEQGHRLPSGVYFARVQTQTHESRQKLWLVR